MEKGSKNLTQDEPKVPCTTKPKTQMFNRFQQGKNNFFSVTEKDYYRYYFYFSFLAFLERMSGILLFQMPFKCLLVDPLYKLILLTQKAPSFSFRELPGLRKTAQFPAYFFKVWIFFTHLHLIGSLSIVVHSIVKNKVIKGSCSCERIFPIFFFSFSFFPYHQII